MVTTRLMSITPELASEWLQKNYIGQRKISQRVVNAYAHDIKNGNWDIDSPDPIMFSTDDTLINGQHRLHAIIRAGIPCVMLVGTGYRKDTYAYLDNGYGRRVSDYLPKNAHNAASVLSVIYALENGDCPIKTSLKGTTHAASEKHGCKATRVELIDYYNEHMAEIDEYVRAAHRMRTSIRTGSEKAYAACVWLIKNLNVQADKLDEYVDSLCQTGSSIIAETIKTTILKAYTKTQRPTMDWLLGILLQGYDVFYSRRMGASLNKAVQYLAVYDNKLKEYRASCDK